MEQQQSRRVSLFSEAHTGMPQRCRRPITVTRAMHFHHLQKLIRTALEVEGQQNLRLNLMEGNLRITEGNFADYLQYIFQLKEADSSVDLLVSIEQPKSIYGQRLTYIKSRSSEEGGRIFENEQVNEIILAQQSQFKLRIKAETRKRLDLKACINLKEVGSFLSTLNRKGEPQPFMEPDLWIQDPIQQSKPRS